MKSFFGALLLGVGILIAGASGLCMLLFFGGALFSGGPSGQEQLSMLPAVVIVGGVPLAIGIGLFFLGRTLLRQADTETRARAAGQPEATPVPEADDPA